MWLHSLKVAQLLRSAACLQKNQSRSYLNHLVYKVTSNQLAILFLYRLGHVNLEYDLNAAKLLNSVIINFEQSIRLKAGLHVRVNYRESCREHLAKAFRRESKSSLAGSLRSLLRASELRDLSEYEVSLYT